MTRDRDLLRQILLDAEADRSPSEAVSVSVWNAHLTLLVEAGYVESLPPRSLSETRWRVKALTWRGYEALDLIRDGARWEALRTLGDVPFELLVQASRQMAGRALGVSTEDVITS